MSDIQKELLRAKVYAAGYEVRHEKWSLNGDTTPMYQAYSPTGGYIGDAKFARRLTRNYEITHFCESRSGSRVVNRGYSAPRKKWYGWSHRAIFGFGIGDMLFEEDFGDEHTKFNEHGSVEIKTLEQAEEAAARFAEYVG